MYRTERLKGAIYGLLIGDALGVPYEFHDPGDLPPDALIEFEPPAGFDRAHPGTPPGTWSDDGAHALLLLRTLLDCGRLDLVHFSNGLQSWFDRGLMTPDGRVFDVGIQTERAIIRLRQGIDPRHAGSDGVLDNGNGSLMRVLPLALWHIGSSSELIEDAFVQSAVTHGHSRAQLCCALYCLWARQIAQGSDVEQGWSYAVASLRDHLGPGALRDELEMNITPEAVRTPRGSGYVVDCLFSARWALQAPSFEAVVKRAVSLGKDTDTTACVAGGLAGLRFGYEAIPERWRKHLLGQHLVEPLIAKLLAKVSE